MREFATEVVESDVLILGGGMGGCGVALEAAYWAKAAGLSVKLVDKAAIDRSGAIAMGLSAINTYMGQDGKVTHDQHTPEEFVEYVTNDQMGLTRQDLVYDMARHVDSSVKHFDKWGLPIWKDEAGNYSKSGKWQVMISGESYKVIVAEAAKNALGMDNIYERIVITHLLKDEKDPNRVCGAVGFSTREDKFYVFKAKAVYCGMGGAVGIFRPRSQGEALGRSWYPPFNSGTTYALMLLAGAELTQMDVTFVPPRFKDSYGPVGTFFLLFKTPALDAYDQPYVFSYLSETDNWAPYSKVKPTPTPVRNYEMILATKAGKAPLMMHTEGAAERIKKETPDPKEQKKELRKFENEAWEDFLDMTISGATNWAAHNVDPLEKPMEIMTGDPVFIGSHASSVGAWCCGAEDLMPAEYKADFPGQYNLMTTVMGLFTGADGVGASAHKFSSGSHVTGRIAGKAAVKLAYDSKDYTPAVSDETINKLKETVLRPLALYEEKSTYTTTPDINPEYVSPNMFMFRLQKIMGENAGGWETLYGTSDKMLEQALWKLGLCGEDTEKIGAADLHDLERAWENIHRYWVAEACARTRMARKESRWPGYYHKYDYLKLDEGQKHFVNVKYDVSKKEWEVIERPMVPII
ncbi:MAG: adenylyl-sulfate reductase subunit alpha [Candidatus Aquicultor secundus]|uniref:adenylyl-sulfate reductase subunit alpha n=1 Tax=Candidatus Aquicultor secundus TaxID=1973895 RepID=UPI000CA96084|nr:adenylyl-sulfate reductase subunit alpha [Candidatus Aquicultor secundus]PIU27015.1 MAG: adenylyl-sulfate reductase subunit alpha [Candidatus Aquicultor secundus]PIW21510.1 MAG: adenylyl-sulfate reductase subunit alpha [Candidatus Aquicultor secundus]PIY42307.1 MAG: adenylyl-sulfate reductase subunit alpha [Candidatus Aquicultor secundus]PJB81185.1 MAG: adenylyl-sulfate reductase subunit alpha [Candidatus Aquicultor secundus]